MDFVTFHILGISSSQLTKSVSFQRGGEKTPTRYRLKFGPWGVVGVVVS